MLVKKGLLGFRQLAWSVLFHTFWQWQYEQTLRNSYKMWEFLMILSETIEKFLSEILTISPITSFSHILMRQMRKWEILNKYQNFSWFHLKWFQKYLQKLEKLWHSNKNVTLSHENMRKRRWWQSDHIVIM